MLKKKKSLNTEIFGESSDEEDAPPRQAAVPTKKPKRLLKQRPQKGDGASDDDDVEAMDMEPILEGKGSSEDLEADTSNRVEINSSKRSRVITDSDDEES